MKKALVIALVVILIILMAQPMGATPLEKIEQRGKLIVAVKDNLPPLGFRDNQGNLQGLEIDLAKKLAAELLGDGAAVMLLPVSNQERLNKVMSGEVDMAIARLTYTDSRSRLVDFSPYYYIDGTAIVSKNPEIRKRSDLASGKILVLNGSSTIAVVQSRLPNAQLIGVDSYQEALTMLEAGEAEGFAADQSLLTGWVREYPQYHLLGERLSTEALCVAMPKGLQYQQLRTRVNRAIASWQSTWLSDRITYWGLP